MWFGRVADRDEAAADVTETRVVNRRCREPDTARMILVLFD